MTKTVPIALDPEGFNELRQCRSGPMLYNKNDIYVGGSLRKYGEFSLSETTIFRQIVRSPSIVIEVGANIGAHSVDLSRLAGPGGELHAFEPQRIPFQTLCANVALNQCTNVYAQQAAVGAELGSIKVPLVDPTIRNNFGGISLVHGSAGEDVPLVTVDSLDLPACHLMKVDVEGMEIDVVNGAIKTIDRYRPIMYLENDREERSELLLTLVMDLGYEVYWHRALLFNPANFAEDPEDLFPGIVSINILCVPAERGLVVNGMPRVESAQDSWRTV